MKDTPKELPQKGLKTKIFIPTNLNESKRLLLDLITNNEIFHPDDHPAECVGFDHADEKELNDLSKAVDAAHEIFDKHGKCIYGFILNN